jgi:hypothetical protein
MPFQGESRARCSEEEQEQALPAHYTARRSPAGGAPAGTTSSRGSRRWSWRLRLGWLGSDGALPCALPEPPRSELRRQPAGDAVKDDLRWQEENRG